MSQKVIEIRSISKQHYGEDLLSKVSFEVAKGETFCIFGPKNSGQDELIKVIYGLSRLDEGEGFVIDLDIKTQQQKIRRRMGIMSNEEYFDSELSIYESLYLFGEIYGIEKNELRRRLLDRLRQLGLEHIKASSYESVSLSDKRRVLLLRALLHDPEVVILEHPTRGLSQTESIYIWEFIEKHLQGKKTVLLSTSDQVEAMRFSSRIAILNQGRLVACGSPLELIGETLTEEVIEVTCRPDEAQYYSSKLEFAQSTQSIPDGMKIFLNKKFTAQSVMSRIENHDLKIRKPNLEDVFHYLVGRTLQQAGERK